MQSTYAFENYRISFDIIKCIIINNFNVITGKYRSSFLMDFDRNFVTDNGDFMPKSKYNVMVPNDCAEMGEYEEMISYALQEDAYNIALVGPNGSGKTSLMKSYSKNNNDSFKFVSLGTLIDNSLSNKEINRKNNSELLNELQLKIIEQLKIGVHPQYLLWKSKLPCEFSNWSTLQITLWIVLIILFLLSLAVIVTCSDLICCWRYRYQILLYLSLFIPPTFLCVQFFVSGRRLRSVARDGLTFEKSSEPFSTYLFDIAYLIDLNNSSVFVFDDLDRLECESFIIGSLRELNTNVNRILQSAGSDKKVKFVYCLTDESMTNSELLTKSFDFIIPMRSYTDTFNASREFVDLLNLPDMMPEVIKIVQAYVSNNRQIINILNYYALYVNQFGENLEVLALTVKSDYKNRIIKSNIFALCSLRALYPLEYSYLFNRKGIIYWLFSSDGMCDAVDYIGNKRNMPFKLNNFTEYISDFDVSKEAISYDLAYIISKKLPENMGYTFNEETDVFEVPNVLSFVSQMAAYGYIDINYWMYLSDLKLSRLSSNDINFLESLCSEEKGEYRPLQQLDNSSLIIDMLPMNPHLSISCLNYSFVSQLAYVNNTVRNSIFSSVIRNIKNYKMYDFVNLCFRQKDCFVIDYMRERFAAEWPDYLGEIIHKKEQGLDIEGLTDDIIDVIIESREHDFDRLDRYYEYSGDMEEHYIKQFKKEKSDF